MLASSLVSAIEALLISIMTGSSRLGTSNNLLIATSLGLAVRRRARSSLLSIAGAVSSDEDWVTKLLISLLRETHHGRDLVKVRHIDRISLFTTHCQQCSSVKEQPTRLENRDRRPLLALSGPRLSASRCLLL